MKIKDLDVAQRPKLYCGDFFSILECGGRYSLWIFESDGENGRYPLTVNTLDEFANGEDNLIFIGGRYAIVTDEQLETLKNKIPGNGDETGDHHTGA